MNRKIMNPKAQKHRVLEITRLFLLKFLISRVQLILSKTPTEKYSKYASEIKILCFTKYVCVFKTEYFKIDFKIE